MDGVMAEAGGAMACAGSAGVEEAREGTGAGVAVGVEVTVAVGARAGAAMGVATGAMVSGNFRRVGTPGR